MTHPCLAFNTDDYPQAQKGENYTRLACAGLAIGRTWSQNSRRIVTEGNIAKFSQHEDILAGY
jgi:hypothetical protein